MFYIIKVIKIIWRKTPICLAIKYHRHKIVFPFYVVLLHFFIVIFFEKKNIKKHFIFFDLFIVTIFLKENMKSKQETLHVVAIAIICSTLASLWKFQYLKRSIYNPEEHLWWSFYCKNSKQLSILTKKLHCRCSLGF